MLYLMDTSTCSFALRSEYGVDRRMAGMKASDAAISVIVLAEAWAGSRKSSKPDLWRERWRKLIATWSILPFDESCAEVYAQIRHDLERRGTMIGIHDCQIAATALTHGLIVVTDNDVEFKRVPGLKVENWIKRSGR